MLFLFEYQVPDRDIEDIRTATNKACVLGNEKFQQQIKVFHEDKLNQSRIVKIWTSCR